MSTTKTLSNGTLSLKFMQRARERKEVQLEKAEVKDDGAWEVPKAVREGWGLTTGSAASETQVHEESYLPFLFSASSIEDTDVQPRGRRVFGKKGEEIVKQSTEEEESGESNVPVSGKDATSATGKGRKIHPRPVSISTAGSSGLKGFEHLKKPRPKDTSSASTTAPTKSARQMIFETANVGTDLRASQQQTARSSGNPPLSTSSEAPKGFMKPAGVDEPTRPSTKNSSDKSGEKKPKRKRPGAQSEGDDRPKKQKKSKV
ncbi:hypothetical protein CC1G_01612 [Coprinopsis cinerea okayama7|uniref:Uncharacterized protein n=1 Tax=Coprinopsis cinerea (strain Okayama-7 / 130 / ATCC MYA-4618 / FGSC 9003) TaxID=240176 RepID=A8NI86_COPC7|nr:hypothetical protein CC1G_01612 [Coprinopsis cinerea okayama7\|eukprot:XP_001833935.2 hypothetical protein CC1G_01612 [Coprinopsis cinerea okayama7\